MRKASTLVGLILVALAATARAKNQDQDPAPPAAPAASSAAGATVPPAPPPPPVAEPVPATAPAAAAAAAMPPAPPATAPTLVVPATSPAPAPRRIEVGLSLLPMGLGKFTASPGGMTSKADAAFSYGFGLRVAYVLVPGLTVGFAPQAFFNVKPKEQTGAGAQEYDLMARVAYAFPVVDTISLYAEVLPGYSLIHPPDGDTSKGLVLGFGVGSAMDLSDRVFANLGVGYQVGFQKLPAKDLSAETKTRYLRVALGVGVRF